MPKENKQSSFCEWRFAHTHAWDLCHLTSSASHTHVQDDMDTIYSPRSSAVLEPKKKNKKSSIYNGQNKKIKKQRKLLSSYPVTPDSTPYALESSSFPKVLCSFPPNLPPLSTLVPSWHRLYPLSFNRPLPFLSSSISFNLLYMSRFMPEILTHILLCAAPPNLSIALLLLIVSLDTTGSGGAETSGEKDRDKVGAAAEGGEERGRTSRVIDTADGADGVFDITALPGRMLKTHLNQRLCKSTVFYRTPAPIIVYYFPYITCLLYLLFLIKHVRTSG